MHGVCSTAGRPANSALLRSLARSVALNEAEYRWDGAHFLSHSDLYDRQGAWPAAYAHVLRRSFDAADLRLPPHLVAVDDCDLSSDLHRAGSQLFRIQADLNGGEDQQLDLVLDPRPALA